MYANRIIAGLLFGLVTCAANAWPITFNFTGTVTGATGIFAGQGSDVTGSYTFDTGLVDIDIFVGNAVTDQFLNNAFANQALTSTFDVTVTVGAETHSTSANANIPTSLAYNVSWNDSFLADLFQFTARHRAPGDDFAQFLLEDRNPIPPDGVTPFTGGLNDMPLTTALDPSKFSHTNIGRYDVYDSGGTVIGRVDFRFDTIVISPGDVVEDVIEGLLDIIADNPDSPELADKLEDAVTKLEGALVKLAKLPPDEKAALKDFEKAADEIERAVEDMLLTLEEGAELMDPLAEVARQLAETAIEEAIDRGGKPVKILKAENLLLEADALRMAGSFSLAIDAYKDSLKKAAGA